MADFFLRGDSYNDSDDNGYDNRLDSSNNFAQRELGGVDEAFVLPGGGLMNHDLYHRACETEGTTLVELLGEGTFHQYHGGAATSRRFGWKEMQAEYQALRSRPYRPPTAAPLYVGRVGPTYLRHLEHSVRLALGDA